MGGQQAKPEVIHNETTNVGFFNISYHWDSIHAQSLGLGVVFCVVILIAVMFCCGKRILHFCIPARCRGMGRVDILPRHQVRRPTPHQTPIHPLPVTPLYTTPSAPSQDVPRWI